MKMRLLVAAILLLTCGGCVVGYYDPYPYYPSYQSYYYYPSYRPPAVYYNPGWMYIYPNVHFGYGHRGHYYHGHGYRHYRH